MSRDTLPLPPLEMRVIVGPTDPAAFDNPAGHPIYDFLGLPLEAYEAVFDFGCGCGRQARQLLQQTPRPRRYVGIDIHKGMVEWCRAHLHPIDPHFQFHHHDVYSPNYAPANSIRLAEPFPVEDGAFTLVLAHSVFTHLSQAQSDYYLHEVARILRPGGFAYTSWFFFDPRSVPFLPEGRACLFISDTDPAQAVIYDREWFIQAVRRAGLSVWRTEPPGVPGHQWLALLTPRAPGAVDRFPLGEEAAEWLCGATHKPMAAPRAGASVTAPKPTDDPDGGAAPGWPEPPLVDGALAELAVLRRGWAGRIWLLAKAVGRWLRR